MFVNLYLIFATIILLALALIWNQKGWINISIKVILGVIAISGILACLIHFGYIVQVN